MELLSVFMSAPLFTVLHGRQELGYVDVMTFLSKQEGSRVLLLDGRSWQVNHVDWQRRMAYVEPTEAKGRTRWDGQGQGLGFHLSQAIKRILATEAADECWSRRATDRLTEIRHQYAWLDTDSTVAVQSGAGETEWWTFGGIRANASIARQLSQAAHCRVDHDSFTLSFESSANLQDVEDAIRVVVQQDAASMYPEIDDSAIDGLKFSECLPNDLAIEMLERRLQDTEATRHVLQEKVRSIVLQ